MQLDEINLLLGQEKPRPPKKTKTSLDLCLFSATLSRLLQGGVPLLQALEIFAGTFENIREGIRQGGSFSEVLAQEALFPDYFVQVIRAGEISGTLDQALKQISEELAKQNQTKRKIREALAYPLLVLSLGIVTLFVILKVVLPKLTVLYSDLEGELPLITRMILGLSHFFLPAVGVLILTALFLLGIIKKKGGKMAWVFFKFPVIGGLMRKMLLYRFSSFLALFLRSGIPILEALEITQKASGFEIFRRDLEGLRQNISEGRGLAGSLKDTLWIDKTSFVLIRAGEEAGKLEETLAELARTSEREIDSTVQWMVKLLEPLLILAVGAVTGIIVAGAILPIFEINGLVS